MTFFTVPGKIRFVAGVRNRKKKKKSNWKT